MKKRTILSRFLRLYIEYNHKQIKQIFLKYRKNIPEVNLRIDFFQKITKKTEGFMQKHHYGTGMITTGLLCSSIFLFGCTKKEKKQVEERVTRVTVQQIEKREDWIYSGDYRCRSL